MKHRNGHSKNTTRKRRHLSRDEKEFIFRRDHYRCCKCNTNLIRRPLERRIDHKLPFSKGGTDELSNLQLLCAKCDIKKGDVVLDDVQSEYIAHRLKELEEEQLRRKEMFFNKNLKGSMQ